MADLLLELFSEEIPARMQERAMDDIQSMLKAALEKAGFVMKGEQLRDFVTPRRLAVSVENLPVQQADVNTELKGPKIDAPDAALQGFLKKSGLKLEQLEKRDGIYIAAIHQKGKATADVLKPIIEDILASFPWPKSMRWGNNNENWVRPLHSILCVFDGKVIPVTFGPVTAGAITYGHRFLSPGAITIKGIKTYEEQLVGAFVRPHRNGRKEMIRVQAADAATKKSLTVKDDPALLEEVTGLVEYPVVLTGTIDDKFMDLPPEVLTTVMRSHQKYFALNDKDGKLSPHFLIVANTDKGAANIIAGNERVLRARFSDARFFWDQDRKKPLSDWAKGLSTVTFHAKLGTIADKVERIKTLALQLVPYISSPNRGEAGRGENLAQPNKTSPHPNPPPNGEGISALVERAATLCKADLVTGMVGEFAELQGVMGRYYAQGQNEDTFVADAIRDHYLPLGPSSPVPNQPVAICVALADKLDTLVSMFAIGEKPTGSKDPFALRRSALGIIRIILENNIRLKLAVILSAAKNLCKDPSPSVQDDILQFFADRLIVQLKDQNIRHDVIKAVLSDGDDDFVRVVARAKAVQDFIGSEDGKNLLAGYKRAANILAIEERKDKIAYAASDLKATALKELEEKALAVLLDKKSGDIEGLRKGEKFVEAMKLLAELRAPVDLFFDKIMVNCDDKDLRANRLRLLARIRAAVDSIANFALIEG